MVGKYNKGLITTGTGPTLNGRNSTGSIVKFHPMLFPLAPTNLFSANSLLANQRECKYLATLVLGWIPGFIDEFLVFVCWESPRSEGGVEDRC